MYAKYRKELSPAWLQSPKGAAFQEVLGQVQNETIQRAKQAALAGYPGHAPEDALPIIGIERQLPRAANETLEQYRARLRDAMELWRWAGTRKGVTLALNLAGWGNVYLVINQEWEPKQQPWSRYYAVIGKPHDLEDDGLWPVEPEEGEPEPEPVELWADEADPNPGLWDTNITPEQTERLREVLELWQPAHASCDGVIVNFDTTRVEIPDEWVNLPDGPLSTGERILLFTLYPEGRIK